MAGVHAAVADITAQLPNPFILARAQPVGSQAFRAAQNPTAVCWQEKLFEEQNTETLADIKDYASRPPVGQSESSHPTFWKALTDPDQF